MNYLNVENISKSYGELRLFENLSFSIHKDQKIAFVAKNGTGKTSLLNLISGKDKPDSGKIIFRKGLRTAFLSQEPKLNEQLTIEQTIYDSDNPVLEILSNYHDALNQPDDSENYQKAFDEMDRHQAWDFETKYTQILFKLKLENLDQKVETLSGGQKKRLALANTLLSKPDLLILDEPTNHLDLEMIEWLESFFAKEKITLFMVTHDRYFLERVCSEIVELDEGNIYQYKGNYSYFLTKKQERIERLSVEATKAKQLFKKELNWMRRQPKARTTKSKSRIDDFFQIKEQAKKRREEHEIQLEINMERLGNKILELHKVSKAYGNKKILEKFDYSFQKGSRIGIIGRNGSGKSSFLNLITNTTQADSGKIVLGETVKFGYYNQNGIVPKPQQKVIEVIRDFGDYIPLKKGRQISAQQLLERFLFSRKKQYDFVEKLSGGEKKRLYLCTILIQNPNFLILDEPTNDLDIVTLNVLETFLLDFPGCLLVVSHDRYFMDKITDELFVFRGNGVIDIFPGNYSDFITYESSKAVQKANLGKSTERAQWKKDQTSKLSFNDQKEIKTIERQLKTLEFDKKQLEGKFTNDNLSISEIDTLSKELKILMEQISLKENRWLELNEKIN